MTYRIVDPKATLLALFPVLALAAGQAHDVVEDGAEVALEFTLTLEDGTKAQSNVGGEPLVYTHGEHELLPALEQALAGMRVDETRTVTLAPAQGYGEVDPALVVEVPPEQVPEQARKPDTMLIASDPTGNRRPVRVQEVHPDRIVLDFNHPLAGHTLTFLVRVLDIRTPE